MDIVYTDIDLLLEQTKDAPELAAMTCLSHFEIDELLQATRDW